MSGLPQIGTVLGAGGKSAAQTTLGALRSGAGASSDDEGVGMTRQRSMITFGGAQQLVKPAASNALTDASGAPQLEQWQTSKNWLRTLSNLGTEATIGGGLGGGLGGGGELITFGGAGGEPKPRKLVKDCLLYTSPSPRD